MEHLYWNILGLLLDAVLLVSAARMATTLYGSIKIKHWPSIAINATILTAAVLFIVFVLHPEQDIAELYTLIAAP